MIGGAEEDRLIPAHRIEIQDRARPRHQEERRRTGRAPPQVGDQGLLRRLVEPLFDEVDDDRPRRQKAGEQGLQGRRVGSAVLDEQADRSLGGRLQRRIGLSI